MRPDDHKKKKNAQYKKKHGIGDKAKNDDKKGDQSVKKREQSGASSGKTNQNPFPSTSGLHRSERNCEGDGDKKLECSEGNEERRFVRRKLESNWERYEGLDVDDHASTDTTESIGADFQSLLHVTGGAFSHAQLEGEKDWEEEAADLQQALDCFNINTEALAAALKCIPLYDRLQIEKDAFEDEHLKDLEECSMQEKLLYQSRQNNEVTEPEEHQVEQEPEISCLPEQDEDTSDPLLDDLLNDLPKPLHNVSRVDADNNVQVKDTVVDTDVNTNNLFSHQGKSSNLANNLENTSDITKSVDAAKNEEDELDFLLSLDKPVNVKVGKEVVTSDTNTDNGNQTVTKSEKKTAQSSIPQSTGASTSLADNLDDWLDSVLED